MTKGTLARSTIVLFSILAASTFGCAQNRAQIRDVKRYTIQDFLGTTTFSGSSFSPDNTKLLVSSNATGIYNAYAISTHGGEPERLTDSKDDSIFAVAYFPTDERFLYTSDRGGNELNHLYVREADGTATDLTPGETLKASFYGWAQDDKSFFVGTNERDERFFDAYEYDVKTYKREMIYKNEEGYNFSAISPDKRTLALSKTVTNADSDIYLFDRDKGEMTLITDDPEAAQNSPQTFSPDGKHLYYLTDKNDEFKYLVRHGLEEGGVEQVLKVDWDVSYAYFSKKGKYMVVGINNDASTELRLYDAATMERVDLPSLPGADITSVGLSRDEKHMAFYMSSSRMPRDLFYYEMGETSPLQLTQSLNRSIEPTDLVEGEVVRFDSYDGVEIPGILYKPHQASPDRPVPALVMVHGGPGGQSRIGYSALLQLLCNRGYVIYAINNRGSSGYGKTFFHLDDRKHGEADLDDVVASKKMLGDLEYVDKDRIGIIGGSYGGYMTLAALTFRPDAFEVGIDLFGISNWHRTVQSIPPWWASRRAYLEKEMGDFDDEEFFKAKSPLFHSERIKKPLMVLQGANDPRVLKIESDEIVEAVRKNGVPVSYVVFEDEGHGFVKKENQERGYSAIVKFLDEHLARTPESVVEE
ncbi:MAG: S9 family peptidase [Planctomycetota bacterium]|nr:S9 family peptidase [Planctomycetota bacterium]